MRQRRESYIDVVYLGWPIAPSYMSPNAGEGDYGTSANEYSCVHGAQINFGELTPYLTSGATEQSLGDTKVKFCHLFHENQKINLATYSFYGLEPPRLNIKVSQRTTIFSVQFAQSSLFPIGWHRSAHFLNRFLFPHCWQLCNSC